MLPVRTLAKMIRALEQIQKRLHEVSTAWTFYEEEIVNVNDPLQQRTVTICIAALNAEMSLFTRGIAIQAPFDAPNEIVGRYLSARRALRAFKFIEKSSIVYTKNPNETLWPVVHGLQSHGIGIWIAGCGRNARWTSGQIVGVATENERRLLETNQIVKEAPPCPTSPTA